MIGNGFLVFHDGSNTSYANRTSAVVGIVSSTTAVTINFLGKAGTSVTANQADSVILTVTAGQEESVIEFLAQIASDPGGMYVIADDQNSVYAHTGITAVSSISTTAAPAKFQNVITGAYSTNDIALTNAQSGSLVTLPVTGAASTITLPTSPISGCNYEFVAEVAGGSNTITIAGAFEGVIDIAGTATAIDAGTSVIIGSSKQAIGDNFKVIYTGVNWFIDGTFVTASAVTHS